MQAEFTGYQRYVEKLSKSSLLDYKNYLWDFVQLLLTFLNQEYQKRDRKAPLGNDKG